MRYQSQNVLSVLMKCLVMTDEIVVDVTRSTQIVLGSPVVVHVLSQFSLFQHVPNKLLEQHVICGRQRSKVAALFSNKVSSYILRGSFDRLNKLQNNVILLVF